MEIGILICLLLGLHSTFGYFKSGTQHICFSSPKEIDFKTPNKELWQEGKFHFTKDKSPECEGRVGTLMITFKECEKFGRVGCLGTWGYYAIMKIYEHEHYSIKFNGNVIDVSPPWINVHEPVIYINYENINNGTIAHTSFYESLKNREIKDCLRIIGSCIMICVEEFKSMHFIFEETNLE
nr:MAG: hypothetical protein [Porcellio scaber clopovirus]